MPKSSRNHNWIFGISFIKTHLIVLFLASFVLVGNFLDLGQKEELYIISIPQASEVVEVINGYTPFIDEDLGLIKLALEEKEFIDKPNLFETVSTSLPIVGRRETISYTVQEGDTISGIGAKYGLKIATLKYANDLGNEHKLSVGQTLKIPPADFSASKIAQLAQGKVKGQTKKVASRAVLWRERTKEGYQRGGGISFRFPTRGFSLSQGFGRTRYERFHDGIDLDSKSGTTLHAPAPGKVVETNRGWGQGYGNYIIIDHGGGWQTFYGHMSNFQVRVGDVVDSGQVIGQMGSSGWSTGTHVHFKMTKNGSVVNPLNYINR